MMEDTAEITLVLTKESIEKLRELAGSELTLSECVAMLIQRVYTEHRVFGNSLGLEQMVTMAENIAQQNRDYQKVIGRLRAQFNRLAVSQEELMATVEQLRDTSAELSENAKKRNSH